MLSPMVAVDNQIARMPPIRINANRTMAKYRLKQEEIEN